MRTLALLLLMTALPLSSQDHSRSVEGTVTDKAGNTLPKAVVELENTMNLQIQSRITDAEGHYRFNDLNPGVEFTLIAKYRNTWSKKATLSKFNEQKIPVINLVIPVE